MEKLVAIKTGGSPSELHHWLTGVINLSRKSFVVMGHLLYELKSGEKYREAIGSGIDTWEDYLKQPEISLTQSEANRFIQIYERFILELGFDEEEVSNVPIKNMHYLLPIAKKSDDKEFIEALMYDAQNLPQSQFKERLYDVKNGEGALKDDFEYMVMKRRVQTNTVHRVKEISSEQIKQVFNLE